MSSEKFCSAFVLQYCPGDLCVRVFGKGIDCAKEGGCNRTINTIIT